MGKKTLRFKVGHRVVCRYGGGAEGGWRHGIVVKQWWCSCGCGNNNCGDRKPYQIKLDDGTLISSPNDTDECIQEPLEKISPPQTHRTAHNVKLARYAAQLRKVEMDEIFIAKALSSELRLKVGDRVQCRMGRSDQNCSCEHGFVVQQFYEEDNYVYPYSIRLDCGGRIYASIDHEEVIKVSDLPPSAGFLVEDDDPLFKMPVQHDVECAICCTPTESLGVMKWQPCCGKHLCNGCLHSTCYVTTHADEDTPCPFCRAPLPKTDEEMFERIRQRVKRNDTTAISNLGNYYHNGTYGLERDALKAFELWSRAEYLGSTSSEMFYSLGIAYNSGEVVEKDAMKVKKYWQRAAMDGHVHARYNLGVMEMNYSPWRAYMHFTIAAKGGNDRSLKKTKQGYLEGFVTKDEFAETLRAYQKTTSARSTKHRDIATAHYAYERKAEEAARNGGSPYVL